MLAQSSELSEAGLPEGCPQHKVQYLKCPESYIFLRIKPELHFRIGDVMFIMGAKGGTTLAHDLKCFHYMFSRF